MIITKISLVNFRNIAALCITPSPGVNIIHGENAQGKTNILESIYYSSLISSFRAARERELVKIGADVCEISTEIIAEEREKIITVKIPAEGRREVNINRVPVRRKADAAGVLQCVLFCPEDLELLRGASALRRHFLDDAISGLWPKYISLHSEYTRLLQHKSRILKDFHENPSLLDTLDDFSARLCSVAANIIPYRSRFTALLAEEAALRHRDISGGLEEIGIEYKTVSTVTSPTAPPPEIYSELWRHYAAHRDAEIASGSCLSGVHKDDLEITIDALPAKNYASQGQTRTAVLALKLAHREIYFRETGEYPVLLFDDVLSELDRGRQEYVLGGIDRGQVFITTCEGESCRDLPTGKGEMKMFHVKQGAIAED
jgi:DNA replication and repair protein RecF